VKFDVLVEVQLLPGISDPQGATIERALPALGYDTIGSLRVGRAFRFEVEARDDKEAERISTEVSKKLLANPVIEQAEVHVTERSGAVVGS
jgi:phosphoribosylformylglycinamidine synthase PurS subunit